MVSSPWASAWASACSATSSRLCARIAGTDCPDSVSRFRRFRSVAISTALWYRSLGSFSSAVEMMRSSSYGRVTPSRAGEVGGWFSSRLKIAACVLPPKALRPVAIS